MHSHNVGQEDIYGLAEHRRLRLDTADAPANDSEPVDHRSVRVGADQRVGTQHPILSRGYRAPGTPDSLDGKCRSLVGRSAGCRTPVPPISKTDNVLYYD